MRQLLLLRHAKSSWDDPATHDKDRTLNARGRRSAILMRDTMRVAINGIDNCLECSAHHKCNGYIHHAATIDKQLKFVDNAKLF